MPDADHAAGRPGSALTRHARFHAVAAARLSMVQVTVEAVFHRHNTSAILRTCDAMGVHRVHLVSDRFVPGRGAARGAERWIDLHTHLSATSAIEAIRADGCAIWIADLDERAQAPEHVPLELGRPVCVWVGAEVLGVGPEAKAAADGVVSLPMHGFAQSLNVSVATAMIVRSLTERARALGPGALLPPAERRALLEGWLARDAAIEAGIEARVTGDGS